MPQISTFLAFKDRADEAAAPAKAETRAKRINVARSKLAAGDRRPCCFDRSGMYDKSMSCPVADTSTDM